MPIPYDYQGDWSRMAKLIVHQSLQTQPGERVIIHADPTYFPDLTEQVRIELIKAGAVELVTHIFHPPGLESVRRQMRRREDPATKAMEDRAMTDIFNLADIYIWLPSSWSLISGQTEDILKTWQGHAIHFHWAGLALANYEADLFRKLSEMFEAALYIDYDALAARQERLISVLRNSTVEITNPAGTDLKFELRDAHFHRGNGNASKEFINGYARPGSARDREVELPSGAIRTVDITNTQGRLVCTDETFPSSYARGGRAVGTLIYEFEGNRITKLQAEHNDSFAQAMWSIQTGDKDKFGEFNIGVSPALPMLPGHPKVIPYFGYGDGILRFSLADNQESGGTYKSSHNPWNFLTDATLKANGTVVIEHGKLVLP